MELARTRGVSLPTLCVPWVVSVPDGGVDRDAVFGAGFSDRNAQFSNWVAIRIGVSVMRQFSFLPVPSFRLNSLPPFSTICLSLIIAGCQSSGHAFQSTSGITNSVRPVATKTITTTASTERSKHELSKVINDGKVTDVSTDDNGKSASSHNMRGAAEGEAGNFKSALTHFNKAIALSPDYYQAYSNRALAYVRLGKLQAAMMDFDQAVHLNPDYAEARVGRGKLNLHVKRHGRAVEDFTRAIALNGQDALAYFNRGTAYQAMGNHHEAIDDFNKASSFHPKRSEPYALKGRSQLALQQHHNALRSFDNAAKRDRRNPELLVLKARAAEGLKLHHQAARDYRRALKLSPRHRAAREGLIRSMSRV